MKKVASFSLSLSVKKERGERERETRVHSRRSRMSCTFSLLRSRDERVKE